MTAWGIVGGAFGFVYGHMEAEHGSLPATPTASTGDSGRHYYFRLPGGVTVGNRAGLADGIDIRGDNGYVVAPQLARFRRNVPVDDSARCAAGRTAAVVPGDARL